MTGIDDVEVKELSLPFEHYGEIQSEEALRYAGEILEFVRSAMA